MRLSILLSTLLYISILACVRECLWAGYDSLSVCPIRSSIRLSDQIDGHTGAGGAKVLGPVPGRPTNLRYSRAGAY